MDRAGWFQEAGLDSSSQEATWPCVRPTPGWLATIAIVNDMTRRRVGLISLLITYLCECLPTRK